MGESSNAAVSRSLGQSSPTIHPAGGFSEMRPHKGQENSAVATGGGLPPPGGGGVGGGGAGELGELEEPPPPPQDINNKQKAAPQNKRLLNKPLTIDVSLERRRPLIQQFQITY
ncbi:hypothetical protein KFE80_13230 [bacterium SCSIO 12696]|nr:hypothetical protein KFE80_13230 [bacterium SCSIO 12696]